MSISGWSEWCADCGIGEVLAGMFDIRASITGIGNYLADTSWLFASSRLHLRKMNGIMISFLIMGSIGFVLLLSHYCLV